MNENRTVSGKMIWGPASVLGLILILLYLQGTFAAKVTPGRSESQAPRASGEETTVIRQTVPSVRRWPGTITSHTVAKLAAKISGRIEKINVDIGALVRQGQLLVRIDDHRLRAQLNAARAALAAARAQAARAAADARRISRLHVEGAATQQALDAALAAARTTKARVSQASHQVEAIQAQLDETRIRAPFAGDIIERLADPGDMALPGKPILTLQNPAKLQIETSIPQHCAALLHIGNTLSIRLPGSSVVLSATVTDIAAAADSHTHTIEVKAALPDDPHLVPGAFAWAEQACGEESTLLIPQEAVSQIGQLEQVTRVVEGRAQVRLVRTGRRWEHSIEILSGLAAGDTILIPARTTTGQEDN